MRLCVKITVFVVSVDGLTGDINLIRSKFSDCVSIEIYSGRRGQNDGS
mgnify:FL=1